MPSMIKTVTVTNDQLAFTATTVAGQMYQAQNSADLIQNNWGNPGNTFMAANGTVTMSDTIGLDSQRFYRIVSLP
ncbi:MAG: hypothetical protein JWR19_746 [Pedosphaera sp.]|nr:hypothetical protein [Pedosphaera sp.]